MTTDDNNLDAEFFENPEDYKGLLDDYSDFIEAAKKANNNVVDKQDSPPKEKKKKFVFKNHLTLLNYII